MTAENERTAPIGGAPYGVDGRLRLFARGAGPVQLAQVVAELEDVPHGPLQALVGVGAELLVAPHLALEGPPHELLEPGRVNVFRVTGDRFFFGLRLLHGVDPATLLMLSALAVIAFAGLRALAAYYNTVGFALVGNRVLTEVEDGKKNNSRTYSLMAREGILNKLRAGVRVPIATNMGSIPQFQYLDVGMNIDCRVEEREGSLALNAVADSSSFSLPGEPKAPGSVAERPVIRQMRSEINTVISLGKTTLISSMDDPSSKRRQALLAHFGGLKGVQAASVDDLARVPGISRALAKRIFAELH